MDIKQRNAVKFYLKGWSAKITERNALMVIFCGFLLYSVAILSTNKPGFTPEAIEIEKIPDYEHHQSPDRAVIIILSYHKNFEKRDRQRSTWLKALPPNFMYKYIFGNSDSVNWETPEQRQKFEKERTFNNDMVVGSGVIEGYRNIGQKVFWGIEWATKLPDPPKYIVKTDDDIQPKVSMMMEIFNNKTLNDTFAYWGYVYDDKVPDRNPSSQWYISPKEYPDDEMFPPYCCGAFYILTMDLARQVSKKIHQPGYTPFPFEDIHLGMVVNSLGYKPQHNNNLYYCDTALSKDPKAELFVHGE